MKKLSLILAMSLFGLINFSCQNGKQSVNKEEGILKVPAEYSSIAEAVSNAKKGDWIIISPGTYKESEIEINAAITVSSEWKLEGDESKIDQTIIDSEDKILFTINADSVEISGLKLVNGDHTLNIEANVSIMHNHFVNNLDGMSFESGGGGYVAYNTAENDRDDALDLDIRVDEEVSGSDILIEHNVFINCNDDGIEIRLFEPHDQNIKYTIRENQIIGSNNAGIQLISYDEYTGKQFYIHHNSFLNCKTGLGCMEGAQTREDLSGATKMDELVYFYNNTVSGCQMGATGGNSILAFNNLIVNNSVGGFKLFGAKSVIFNNLFYQNGEEDFVEINPDVVINANLFSVNPMIDKNTFQPSEKSPCIDAGISELNLDDAENFKISSEYIAGEAPDIGANEFDLDKKKSQKITSLQVDAGENQAVEAPVAAVVLAGRIRNADDASIICNWKQEQGPAEAKILNPNKLITDVILEREGIYRFSIQCSDSKSSASDLVTVRYFNDGEGKQLFLSNEEINTIDAEDYAYSYGKVSAVSDPVDSGNKFVLLDGSSGGSSASLEFSVGTTKYSDCFIWLLVKNHTSEKSSLNVNFNNKDMGEVIAPNNNAWEWIAAPEGISVTAGQRPVIVKNEGVPVSVDKILFSFDEKFNPKE